MYKSHYNKIISHLYKSKVVLSFKIVFSIFLSIRALQIGQRWSNRTTFLVIAQVSKFSDEKKMDAERLNDTPKPQSWD